MIEMPYRRGHRVFWLVERNGRAESEDALVLADDWIDWGSGH
jgi:hypothetical protein